MNDFKDVLKPIGLSAGLLVGIPTAANLATGGELFRQVRNRIAKVNATPLTEMTPPDLSIIPQVITDNTGTTNVVEALT